LEAARHTELIRWSRSPKPANSKHPDIEFALRIAEAASSRRANSINCSTKPQTSLKMREPCHTHSGLAGVMMASEALAEPAVSPYCFRTTRAIALMKRDASMTSLVRPPCRKLLFLFPSGAPPLAPCIRQTLQPRTAGARQRFPVRFDLALHRGAAWALCKGLMVISIWYLPPPPPDQAALSRRGSASAPQN
jgi:hypothetical protein